MAAFMLTMRTAVRGYHVYQDIWTPTVSDQFDCRQEPENEEDRYAVAVYEDSESTDVLGHLPREISCVSYFFLEHDGSITGKVTGRRRYCHQGGMEIPCKLTYSGKWKHIRKLKNYFQNRHFPCIEGIA